MQRMYSRAGGTDDVTCGLLNLFPVKNISGYRDGYEQFILVIARHLLSAEVNTEMIKVECLPYSELY